MAVLKTYQSTSYIGKDGKAPVYVSFYVNREKIVIPCGISVKIDNFDSQSGKIKKGETNHKDMNLIIDQIRGRINNVMVKYRLRDKKMTKQSFMREYNRPNDFDTIFDYFEHYIKEYHFEIEYTTLGVHKDVMNKLKRYSPDLHFDDITEKFILEYKSYLKKKLKNKEATISKNLSIIKKYVRAAVKDGYMLENPFENIKITRNFKGGFTYLTEEELQILSNMYNQKSLAKNYHEVLQFFLFLCFTSLHIGDAKRLKIEQIGSKNFTYYRIKNRNSKPEPITIPISKPARTIIKKVAGKRKYGILFEDLITDQQVNKHLKVIAKDAGLEKSISCKTGRHTFATLFLSKTKDMATLKNLLGHSDYRETLIYAHVLEETKLEGMKIFNDFFS